MADEVDEGDVGQMNMSTRWERAEGEHQLQTPWAFWYDKKQNKKHQQSTYGSIHNETFETMI